MSSINYKNFIIYPDFFDKYNLENPSYGYKIKNYFNSNKSGLIVLFTTPKLPNFYEILTLGDGSCFYYTIEKINCKFHKERKLNYLKAELKDIFKISDDNNDIIEKFLPIPPKSIEDCINDLEKNNSIEQKKIKERIMRGYKGYINNELGLGIELYDIMKELREFKMKAFIHILPLPQKKLEWIIKEMNFSDEEIQFYDYKLQKDIKMFKDEDIKSSDEIIHILFRRDHYSRLIEKSQLSCLEKFCEENNLELKIIDLPD
jgi:DNA-binding PadR family transcriptional regulator